MMLVRTALTVVMGASAALIAPTATVAAPAAVSAAAAAQATTMTAGYAVFDRQRRVYTQWHRGNKRFRSASVVKLLIALDVLWSKDPAQLSVRDRRRLARMLRSSDDNAASYFWGRNGNRKIVLRMSRRLGLINTAPPPPSLRGWWGYTAMTARDTVWIYQFILERARKPVRDAIMWQLHHASDRGSDGFNQNFGVMTFGSPRSAKQGWSGFGGSPPAGVRIPGVSLWREALHTTGTVGRGNRFVTAVFTLHPRGTPASTARARTTRLTRSLG